MSSSVKSCWLAALLVPLLLPVSAGCGEGDPEPATQVIVAITSDLEIESVLSRIEVKIGSRDGGDVVAMRDYDLVRRNPREGQYQLPLSFSVAKGAASSFLIVVTGYGPLGARGAEQRIVEQRAIASFRDGQTLLLRLFLGRVCYENFCENDDEMVCYTAARAKIAAGECGEVLVLGEDDLERIEVEDLPDLARPPRDTVFADGGPVDAGEEPPPDGGHQPPPDAGGDAGGDAGPDSGPCTGDDCACSDAQGCDDGMFCTLDSCDAQGRCRHDARSCPADDNACTLAPVCNEQSDACEEAFDATSLSSVEHCGASATSRCESCAGNGTQSARCQDGRCVLECASGRFDADSDASNGCECTFVSDSDLSDDDAIDANCDGADGLVAGDYTLYVTLEGAGDHSGSTPANAATLPEAFEQATRAGAARELLVAAGDYMLSSPLIVPDQLVVFAGYAPDFRARSGVTRLLALTPSALRVSNAVSGVVFDSLEIKTADQRDLGASTTAVVVDTSQVLFRRSIVSAGGGGPGRPGDPVLAASPATMSGDPGDPAPNTSTGGGGGATGLGGNGGTGGSYLAGVPQSGTDGLAGTRTGPTCGNGGPRGAGQSLSCPTGTFNDGDAGMPGQPGCDGTVGPHGAGGMGPGSITGGAWVGAVAQSGGTGQVGGSGGGGGGGGAAECAVGAAGGGGGEGGVGGPGGPGGNPGGPGGASIAILATSSTLAFEDTELRTGSGGQGGRGGDGGNGGQGAGGGGGGQGASNSSGSPPTGVGGGNGGRGGNGGAGGPGGCGGGGAGGPSVGIFGSLLGTSVMVMGTPRYTIGSGGAGGPACTASGGSSGSANAGTTGVQSQLSGF